jgi:predicted NAD-dependent protein-ADP-ribosyltransferase YbiA (DUF1768 family)
MVKSAMNDDINYSENSNIDEGDIGYDAPQFEVELFPGVEANIALGNVRYTFADKGVLFIPVYLVKNEEIVEQIGIYEFLASRYTELLDEDDDFDISLLDNPLPLYYSFFDEKYLIQKLGKKILKTKKKEPSTAEEKTEIPETNEKQTDKEGESPLEQIEELGDEEIETNTWSSPNKPTVLSEILKEEDDGEDDRGIDTNMQDAIDERSEYNQKRNDPWIKKFMKSSKYNLIDNEGKGDCLFAVIRDAYKGTKDISVEQMRQIVSENATQNVFDNFKERYDLFANEIRATRQTQITLKGDYDDKLKVFKASQDRNEKKEIAKQLKEIKTRFDTAKREYKYAQENVRDFLWMKGINTLEDFKDILKTCKFWAEQWAINVLEVMLNIKLIILSKQNYDVGDGANVLSCGDLIDSSIEEKGEFKPKYYIIVSYTGNHYMLVTYKTKRLFDFATLPFAVKELVITKCMEGETGVYSMIPKFNKLKLFIDKQSGHVEQNQTITSESKMSESKIESLPRTDSGAEDIGVSEEERYDEGLENHKDVSFNEDIVFQFYSKSRDMKPGKGAGEKISSENVLKFSNLADMKNWRKTLSNFYEGKFKLDGMNWLSVEHFYHASKFKKSNPNFYKLFSLDSKSDISKLPAMAKGAGGKTGKFKGKQTRPKNIKIDEDFFSSGENEKAMYRAQMAKYKQNKEAKDVLLATQDAKLQHFLRGQNPIVFYDTMKIREVLRN